MVTYELPSGKTVEVELSDSGGTTREFAAGNGKGGPLDAAMAKLQEALGLIARGIDDVKAMGPDKVEVELSVEIGTNGAVKFLLADAKGGLKITLTWGNSSR